MNKLWKSCEVTLWDEKECGKGESRYDVYLAEAGDGLIDIQRDNTDVDGRDESAIICETRAPTGRERELGVGADGSFPTGQPVACTTEKGVVATTTQLEDQEGASFEQRGNCKQLYIEDVDLHGAQNIGDDSNWRDFPCSISECNEKKCTTRTKTECSAEGQPVKNWDLTGDTRDAGANPSGLDECQPPGGHIHHYLANDIGWIKIEAGDITCSEGKKVAKVVNLAGNEAKKPDAGCDACEAGKYQDEERICTSAGDDNCDDENPSMTDCKACSAGTYSLAGAHVCIECAAGKYSADVASACNDCPTGMTSLPGSVSSEDCYTQACDDYDGTGNGNSYPCPLGKIGVHGGGVSCAMDLCSEAECCVECGFGWWGGGAGDGAECFACPAGKSTFKPLLSAAGFGPTSTATAGEDCMDCVAGKWSADGGACIDCVAGKYSEVAGGKSADTCINCAAGKFSAAAGAAAPGACIDCAAGKYSEEEGADAVGTCKDCVAGKFSAAAGAAAPGTCIDCAEGMYSTSGADACLLCAAGKYEDTGSASCIDCPEGGMASQYRPGATSINECQFDTCRTVTDADCGNGYRKKHYTCRAREKCAAPGCSAGASCSRSGLPNHHDMADVCDSDTECVAYEWRRSATSGYGTVHPPIGNMCRTRDAVAGSSSWKMCSSPAPSLVQGSGLLDHKAGCCSENTCAAFAAHKGSLSHVTVGNGVVADPDSNKGCTATTVLTTHTDPICDWICDPDTHVGVEGCVATDAEACANWDPNGTPEECYGAGACTYTAGDDTRGVDASCVATDLVQCASWTSGGTAGSCEEAGACVYTPEVTGGTVTCPADAANGGPVADQLGYLGLPTCIPRATCSTITCAAGYSLKPEATSSFVISGAPQTFADNREWTDLNGLYEKLPNDEHLCNSRPVYKKVGGRYEGDNDEGFEMILYQPYLDGRPTSWALGYAHLYHPATGTQPCGTGGAAHALRPNNGGNQSCADGDPDSAGCAGTWRATSRVRNTSHTQRWTWESVPIEIRRGLLCTGETCDGAAGTRDNEKCCVQVSFPTCANKNGDGTNNDPVTHEDCGAGFEATDGATADCASAAGCNISGNADDKGACCTPCNVPGEPITQFATQTSACTAFTPCTEGGHGGTLTATDDLSCVECAPGQYAGTSDNECIACAVDKYSDSYGSEICDQCDGTRAKDDGTGNIVAMDSDEIGATHCIFGTCDDTNGSVTAGTTAVSDTDCGEGFEATGGAGECAGAVCNISGNADDKAACCTPCNVPGEPITQFATQTSACTAFTPCDMEGEGGTLSATADLSCVACAPGQYAATSDNECIACPAGFKTDTLTASGGTTCTKCAAGKWTENSTVDCIECVAGKYSDAGSCSNTNNMYNTKETCEGAYFTWTPGPGTSLNDCKECPAGTYSLAGAYECIECATGKYSAAGSDEASDCLDCVAGKYSDVTPIAETGCKDCAAGKYIDVTGSDDVGDCITCAAGKYIDVTGSDDVGDCITCAAGKYSAAGSDEARDCINCDAGKYFSGKCYSVTDGNEVQDARGDPSFTDSAACMAASNANYVWLSGGRSASDCISCPAGKYSDAGSCSNTDNLYNTKATCEGAYFTWTPGPGTSLNDCKACPAGKYSLEGAHECIPCSPGKYFSGKCYDTDGNEVQDARGDPSFTDSAACMAANPNYVWGGGSSEFDCIECAAGNQTDTLKDPGATSCTSCEDLQGDPSRGKYSLDSTVACEEHTTSFCPIGKEWRGSTNENDGTCETCPEGKYSNSTDASSCDDHSVYSCPLGEGWLGSTTKNDGDCKYCTAGKFSDKGDDASACKACGAGQWSYFRDNECRNCPQGTYSIVAGGYNDCISCNSMYEEGRTTGGEGEKTNMDCNYCRKGYYVLNGECIKCIEGYNTDGLAKISEGNTRCVLGSPPEEDKCERIFEEAYNKCINDGNEDCLTCIRKLFPTSDTNAPETAPETEPAPSASGAAPTEQPALTGVERNDCIFDFDGREYCRRKEEKANRPCEGEIVCDDSTRQFIDCRGDCTKEACCPCKKGMIDNGNTKLPCTIDGEGHWRCSDETDLNCQLGEIICETGFVEEKGLCIIDSYHNFKCSEPSLGKRCRGGYAVCSDGFFHDRVAETCDVLEHINGVPTNYIIDEKGELSCKNGYKLYEGVNPHECLLNDGGGLGENWECKRGEGVNEKINDGKLCCDPYEIISGEYKCSSEPQCKEGHVNIGKDCFDKDGGEDCIGEWSPCLSDCLDSTFRITKDRVGVGEDCKDQEGNILHTGSKRSCHGRGRCTQFSNLLCGADLHNNIVNDIENWEWEWVNENIRDRCDHIYKGNLPDCIRREMGDDNTRVLCPLYTGKCRGNTFVSEDVDCLAWNRVPKQNNHAIDKVGNGYDSCCIDLDSEEMLEQEVFNPELARDKRILSSIGIEGSQDIDRLLEATR